MRSCYTTSARPYKGGPIARIRWYFADEDAPFYPHSHAYEPVYLNHGKVPQPDIGGEVPGAQRRWYNGRNPGVNTGDHWCGTVDDFLGKGIPPYLPGIPALPDFSKFCGCSYNPTIGVGVSHRRPVKTDIALECDYTVSKHYKQTAFSEFVIECEFSQTIPNQEESTTEIAIESEYSYVKRSNEASETEFVIECDTAESFGGRDRLRSELSVEIECHEGDPPQGSFKGELSVEIECHEGDPPQGTWKVDIQVELLRNQLIPPVEELICELCVEIFFGGFFVESPDGPPDEIG